jgi:uncharacterized protein YqgQ
MQRHQQRVLQETLMQMGQWTEAQLLQKRKERKKEQNVKRGVL